MPISVNPIFPVISAQGATPDLVLQPGSVVDAEVLKILEGDLVRIAVANLSIDVFTEIPLQAGQTLQLAVSQTQGGIRLAVVGSDAGVAASAPAAIAGDTVTLAPGAAATAAVSPDSAAPPPNLLTPLQRLAVSAATQTAATQQASLAPLFANLGAAAAANGLPPKLQQAIAQVLAQQTSLDQNLDGNAIKSAFQKSGLFLESSLASGSVSPAATMPDLKAALIVLRQTLLSSLGTPEPIPQSPTGSTAELAPPPQPATASTAATSATGTGVALTTNVSVTGAASSLRLALPSLAPSSSGDAGVREILLPQARLPFAEDLSQSFGADRIVLVASPLQATPRAATAGAALNLLQEALQELPREIGSITLAPAAPGDPRHDDATAHTNTPPPPFRGAMPSAQPVASPAISSAAPLATTARHLLADTDAAIARQTLLQVASLPDRMVEAGAARPDSAAPRWNFEIPFATPLGTAMAQFEISRDGGGRGSESARRIWRARFSLDVEPAGPIHALVSLSGDQTSVRMWAERPATAARLRAGAAQLSRALSNAALNPADIVIRDGTPPQPAVAPAGHFLDRAL